MTPERKRPIVVGGLVVLGIAMIVAGPVRMLLPPVLPGVGFLLLTWAHA